MSDKKLFRLVHTQARQGAQECIKTAPEPKITQKRPYKPLSPEKQAKKNAALLAKRRALGVKPRTARTEDETREANRIKSAAYRDRNKEVLAAQRRACAEETRIRQRERYVQNKQEYLARLKRWKSENKESMRLAVHNYRAKKRANGGCLSKDIVSRLMRLQRGTCTACRTDIRRGFHLDHIIPVSLGGENADSNIQLLCPACNMSKQAQHPVEFMQRKGFLL